MHTVEIQKFFCLSWNCQKSMFIVKICCNWGTEMFIDFHTVAESLCRSTTVNWCLTRSIFIRKKMLKVTQAAKAKKILEKRQTFTKGWQKSMTTHASMMLYFFRFVEKKSDSSIRKHGFHNWNRSQLVMAICTEYLCKKPGIPYWDNCNNEM